jgi:hypothetical protein
MPIRAGCWPKRCENRAVVRYQLSFDERNALAELRDLRPAGERPLTAPCRDPWERVRSLPHYLERDACFRCFVLCSV